MLGTGLAGFEPCGEGAQHAADLSCKSKNGLHLSVTYVAETAGNEQMSFEFHQRTGGDREMPEVVAQVLAAVSFGDVGRHGNGGPPHLLDESVRLLARQEPTQFIDLNDQIHRFLPNQQIPITTDHTVTLPR